MKKIRLIILALLPFFAFGQFDDKKVDQLIAEGNESKLVEESSLMLQDGFYFQAGRVVDKLLTFKPNSSNYNYRRGFIYMEMSKNYIAAISHLEKAVVEIDKNYDMFSPNETAAPTDALYHLGHCYHMAGDLPKAREYYTKFIAQSKSSSEFVFFSQSFLKQCDIAEKEMASPRKVSLENVGSSVNSGMPEYSPVVSLDGSALYYTSRREWNNKESDIGIDPRNNLHPEDIYVSFKDFDGTWTMPLKLEFCDSLQNEATMAVSPDERRVYIYQDVLGNGDIFYSDFSTNKFQEVEHYEVKDVNTDNWETHCTFSTDGQQMYFTSNRKGGYGGRDIYKTNKLADGSWSKPINMGPIVNSKFDEESPFISVDNKTLYFSSNNEKSMGGFDIFVTIADENGTFSNPINLGFPTNSTVDDIFYTTTIDGYTGYLTSDRDGGFGEKDIYQVVNNYMGMKNISALRGKINTPNGEPLPENVSLTINCLDCGNKLERKVFPRTRDGVFLSSLEPCHEYELIFSADGQKEKFHRETFKTDCDKEYTEVYREFTLDPKAMVIVPPIDTTLVDTIPIVVVKNFPNLEFKHNFGYNLNKLTVSKGDLRRFVSEVESQLAEGREKITINVYSSASRVPTKTFASNEDLTRARAENMKYDLLSYFQSKSEFKDKVTIVVVSAIVDGPVYEKDFDKDKKYIPYQFVSLKTE